ncbi:ATP-binding cassette domain-containing protein [Intrasporangium sp.]|uniref:ATP-binding cassette domain-containing protein n=1 Tax=Intrasporangium sp. TaxID=1925024 RepID=UPI00293B4064|nr:ATP-binding cassette domain-containing protein [Intrasporangium sp.]MDV3220244.1 ATP-binding cassette domain-containing protein [Intrasporangium sp.]
MPESCSPSPISAAISVRGLRRSFGAKVVLDGIDLEVAPGTVHALLGPNGSGKTTTVNILSTLIRRDAGEVRVGGFDLDDDPQGIRGVIGVTGQFSAVDSLLTGAENLRLMGELNHLDPATVTERSTRLLDDFGLADAAGALPATYSGGMRRRLDLAMTLMSTPRVIFLDEPTTGLDPRSRRQLWGMIRDLVSNGVTVFLTTQYLEEADGLADRISVLDHGRIIAEGSPAELKRLVPGGHVLLEFTDAADLTAAAVALGHVAREADDEGGPIERDSLVLRIPSDGSVESIRSVLARLDHEAVDVAALSVHLPDLDDVFLALTGSDTKETAR